MNLSHLLYCLLTGLICLQACKDSPKTDPADQPKTTQTKPKRDLAKDSIGQLLTDYYEDLSAESVNTEKYFAESVNRFFNTTKQNQNDIAKNLQAGFEAVEERKVNLDGKSLKVFKTVDGYVAEFSGELDYVRTKNQEEVGETFTNRVVFDKNYKITSYENLATEPRQYEKGMPQRVSAENVAMEFMQVLSSNDLRKADAFVDAKKGFFFVYRPGAIDAVEHHSSVSQMLDKHTWLPADVIKKYCKEVQLEPIPPFDCENYFTKMGCFVEISNDTDRLTKLMQALQNIKMTSFSDEELEKARKFEKQCEIQLVLTEEGYSFHFGKVRGQWRLLLLDMSRYSCSA